MYKLKNISDSIKNYTIFGTIVNELEIIENIEDRFEQAIKNGVNKDSIIAKLKADKNLLFEEIIMKKSVEDKKEDIKEDEKPIVTKKSTRKR